MIDPIATLLDAHDNPKPKTGSDVLEMLHALAEGQPDQLASVMLLAMERASPHSVFLDTAMDLLPDDAVAVVATEGWRRYRHGERNDLLRAVVEFASYQAPQVLQQDWEELLGAVAGGAARSSAAGLAGTAPADCREVGRCSGRG